jgi:hypothetical protein
MTHRHMTHHQILFLSMLAVGCVATCAAAQHPETEYSSGQQIALWQDGAPGSVDRKSEPESAKDYWVKNVHDPSVTVYLPEQGKANGTSVVIFPGGGHRMLVFTAEGKEPAKYFTDLGVTAFVVKYRLAREEKSPYKIEVHPKQDAQRAIRWVRSHAQDFQIDPERIGIVGFSAGGEVASMVAYSDFEGTSDADGPIDDVSCHSNFQVLWGYHRSYLPTHLQRFWSSPMTMDYRSLRSNFFSAFGGPMFRSSSICTPKAVTASTWATGRSSSRSPVGLTALPIGCTTTILSNRERPLSALPMQPVMNPLKEGHSEVAVFDWSNGRAAKWHHHFDRLLTNDFRPSIRPINGDRA